MGARRVVRERAHPFQHAESEPSWVERRGPCAVCREPDAAQPFPTHGAPMTRRIFIAILLVSSACKRPPPAVAVPTPSSSVPAVPSSGPSTSVEQATAAILANFARVHFDLDSTTLSASAQSALHDNARLLREHPSIRVEVQGHADERGSVDYNLALGQRRADSVSRALTLNGVDPTRIRTVSFGEERPASSASNDRAWSLNRRCEFRVIAGTGVQGTTE